MTLWQWSVQDTPEEDAQNFHSGQSLKKSTHFFPQAYPDTYHKDQGF